MVWHVGEWADLGSEQGKRFFYSSVKIELISKRCTYTVHNLSLVTIDKMNNRTHRRLLATFIPPALFGHNFVSTCPPLPLTATVTLDLLMSEGKRTARNCLHLHKMGFIHAFSSAKKELNNILPWHNDWCPQYMTECIVHEEDNSCDNRQWYGMPCLCQQKHGLCVENLLPFQSA